MGGHSPGDGGDGGSIVFELFGPSSSPDCDGDAIFTSDTGMATVWLSRFVAYTGTIVLLGGWMLVALAGGDGPPPRRTRVLIWSGLGAAVAGTVRGGGGTNTLDFATLRGEVTFSGGAGQFSSFRAKVDVSHLDGLHTVGPGRCVAGRPPAGHS
jgi:hypothetical protein